MQMTGERGHLLQEGTERKEGIFIFFFFFWLCCQESQFPSVGLMHCFISNSVGFAQEQLSETIAFNAEWNVFWGERFSVLFFALGGAGCASESCSPQCPLILQQRHQSVCGPHIKCCFMHHRPSLGYFCLQKLLPLQKVSQKNTHIVLSWARDVIFVLSSLVCVFVKAKAVWANWTCCLWGRKESTALKHWEMQLPGDPGFVLVGSNKFWMQSSFPEVVPKTERSLVSILTEWLWWCPRVEFCIFPLSALDFGDSTVGDTADWVGDTAECSS